MQIFEVYGDVILNDNNTNGILTQMSNTVDRLSDRMSNMSNTLANVGAGLSQLGSSLIEKVSKPIFNVIKDSIMLSSDLTEAYNVVDVTFGDNADAVKDWSRKLLQSFGLVELEAINYVGSMGAMLKSSGFTATAAKEMSQKLVELTGDMSSFYNLSHEETWEKIRSGISGETEPLKALGINMSVANLEAYALTRGIKEQWKEMNQAEQTTLRYNYLMQVTSDSQGDFSNTVDSFGNRLRLLTGTFVAIKTELGERFLPTINLVLGEVIKLVSGFQGMPSSVQNIIIVIGLAVAAIGPFVAIIGGSVTVVAALTAAIAFLGPTLTILSAAAVPVIAAITALSAVMAVGAYKSGLLSKAFNYLKNIALAVTKIIEGDLIGAFDILTEKLGFSKDKANIFTKKIISAKSALKKLKEQLKDVTALLGVIFSEDSQELIDLLISKFGYSKKEAQKFAKEIDNLRKKIDKASKAIKDFIYNRILKLSDGLDKNAKSIDENNNKIAKAIEKFATWSNKILTFSKKVNNASKALDKFIKNGLGKLKKMGKEGIDNISKKMKTMGKNAKTNFDKMVKSIRPVIRWLNSVKDAVNGVINKISNIKFPSPPGWIPGFARGVKNFVGGMALVGENGPEIVKLPKGADVVPNHQIKDTLKEPNFTTNQYRTEVSNKGQNIEIVLNNTINNQNDVDYLLTKLMQMLKSKGVSLRNA